MSHFDVYFHLGLPKVASTFLQKKIFPNFKAVLFHKKHSFNDYKNLDANSLSTKHLFSSEYDRGLEEVVDEIVAAFPNARFIFVVRRQDRWILSKYKYHIRKHGSESFEAFFNLTSEESLWKREELLFQKKIEYIVQAANTKPLILLHDDLKANATGFIQQIATFLGAELIPNTNTNSVVNKAFNNKQLIIVRKFNELYPYTEAKSNSKLLNKVHYKYREFLLHIIAFLCNFVPSFFIKKKVLLQNTAVLEQIQQHYAQDWAFCEQYAKSTQSQ